jgi:hypothetical protein
MRIPFAVFRVAAAALIIAAIVAQLQRSYGNWIADGVTDLGFQFVNFFSFFTIESNVFSIVVLLIGASLAFAKRPDTVWFNVARGTVATYMITTGIVYNLLLRNVELPQGTTVAWSNEVLHVVAPIVLLVDWLFAPGRLAMASKTVWIIVSFPLVWGAYTLIRGPFAFDERLGRNWYPYPFMNPELSANGYLTVAFFMILIALVIGAAGAGVIWLSRRPVLLSGSK